MTTADQTSIDPAPSGEKDVVGCTCRTCKHWNLEFEVTDDEPERFSRMGVCDLITGNDFAPSPYPDNFAATAYGYGLFTGPEFACSLWEGDKSWEFYDI